MKLLIVEDNNRLLDTIQQTLSAAGFLCEIADSFLSAREKLALYRYDLIVVDINLPDGSGLELIKACKSNAPETGIVVISARNSIDNKVEGLELGADDYLTKPFDIAELIARVKSVIRRRNFKGDQVVCSNGISVETQAREVFVNDTSVDLTRSEYNILLFLLSNPNRVLTKESIAEHIWGDNMDLVDSFDFIYSHIKNLKKKITDAGGANPVKTVYGVGYKWADEE